MEVIASGNAIVDAIGMMNFTGNVIPEAWYSELRFKSGKPHMNAIMILSDIVYWYRPRESRNEYDGTVVFEKKFKDEEYLQRSYKQISEKFGISEGQAKSAIVFLEKDIGVIIRHFKKITTAYGSILSNVLFLELVPKRLEEITYPFIKHGGVSIERHTSVDRTTQVGISIDTGVSLKQHTYTKNTTKNINKDYKHQSLTLSESEGMNDRITCKRNEKKILSIRCLEQTYGYENLCNILTYENFLKECNDYNLNQLEAKNRVIEEIKFLISYDNFLDFDNLSLVDSILDYISDIIITHKDMVFNDVKYDIYFLANKFFQLDYFSIQYVINKFNEVSSEIKIVNKKNYLIKMLITAKSDMETDIQGNVNYDLAHLNDD